MMKKKPLFLGGILLIVVFAFSCIVAAAGCEFDLATSIQLAFENNRDVKMAIKDRETAYWRLQELKANKLPVLNLKHTDSHLKPNPYEPFYMAMHYDPPITDYFDNQLSLSLPLYTGGQLEGLIKQADISLKIAEQNVVKTKQQTKLAATVAYYNLLQTNSLVKLNQETVERLAAHLKNVKTRLAIGVVTKNDVLRTEVELSSAEENLIKSKNNYDLAMANFNNVMGLPLDTEISVKEDLSYKAYEDSLESCTAQALKNRPEAQQTDFNYQSAKNGVAIAKSGYLPTVSFVGAIDQKSDTFPGNDYTNWSLSLISSWNLYNSGQTKSRVNQAVSLQDKALEASFKTKDTICLEVRQTYLSLKEAEKRIQTCELALNEATEDFQLTLGRYNTGVGINLDVLDSQVALAQIRTRYINSLYDYNVSLAQLQKAIGN
jgi:outer membrane protein